ncbi:unnamed protein product [Cuscuta campestris]|uniref:Uncharacterized protein n=1 Tax=Cuscuta campestris TaxID=132261 RepID=A0A484NNC7_9ASTE|nr:unnamed protein product [Cuscuta campestris]
MAFMALWRGYGARIGLCMAMSLRRGMAIAIFDANYGVWRSQLTQLSCGSIFFTVQTSSKGVIKLGLSLFLIKDPQLPHPITRSSFQASSHNPIVSSTLFSCESAPILLSQQQVAASSGYFSVDFLQVVSAGAGRYYEK